MQSGSNNWSFLLKRQRLSRQLRAVMVYQTSWIKPSWKARKFCLNFNCLGISHRRKYMKQFKLTLIIDFMEILEITLLLSAVIGHNFLLKIITVTRLNSLNVLRFCDYFPLWNYRQQMFPSGTSSQQAHCLVDCRRLRRGFTIRLKRLKPRAADFGGPQNFGSKTISRIFVSNCIFVLFWFTAHFLLCR